VVNTDGDNQYPQDRIGDLVKPIVAGEADIVIADRQTQTIAHFSPYKKLMQRVGSQVVNRAASTELPDAASGFRAYSRASLLRLNVITQFSYCMETIIQAGNKRMRIGSVAVVTNAKTRESRLFKNTAHHMVKSASAILRSYLMFKPYVIFATLTVLFGVAAAIPFLRFLVLWVRGLRQRATSSRSSSARSCPWLPYSPWRSASSPTSYAPTASSLRSSSSGSRSCSTAGEADVRGPS